LVGIEGIILAAGFSKRAGAYKMTLDIGGKTLIENCIEGMYNVCSRIIIVGGYGFENILRITDKYPKTELVLNVNYRDGMYSSVKKGLEYIKGECFFLTPGDYPAIHTDVYESMLDTDGEIVIPTYKGEKGHPVLMKSYLVKEICQNSAYSNLQEFIGSKGFMTVEVQDRGILMDVDTMEDYKKACKYVQKNNIAKG
jgi:molybdenum cofactor cytidylyltransferase